MEEEQYDKAIILFEGFQRDYEDAEIISGNKVEINESKNCMITREALNSVYHFRAYIYGKDLSVIRTTLARVVEREKTKNFFMDL